jgi:hypothetical protein
MSETSPGHTLLAWVNPDDTVVESEARLPADVTLGPAAIWGGDLTVRDWLRERSAWRLNPAMGRLEELVSAFEYAADGALHRTRSTPREACGPELRTLLFDRLDIVTRVELRLLPRQRENWLALSCPDAAALAAFVRERLRQGCFFRALATDGARGWASFCGGMAEAYADEWRHAASPLRYDCQWPAEPPGMRRAGFHPRKKSWLELDAGDKLVLADPWAVLVE